MIAFVEGKIVYKDPAYVIVETVGIGYLVKITLNTYSAIKNEERFRFLTYLHIKEDAHTLYGFSTNDEKSLFLDLIGISGIGPGTAVMVLSSLAPSELRQSIISEDVRTIQSIKGIGAKTAQRIILELKDKLKKTSVISEVGVISSPQHNTIRQEALSALVTLGIAKAAAEKSIDTVLKKEGATISLEQLIKQALKTA